MHSITLQIPYPLETIRYTENPSESLAPGNVNRFKISYTHVRETKNLLLFP